jgi:hypothetical protein
MFESDLVIDAGVVDERIDVAALETVLLIASSQLLAVERTAHVTCT